MTITVGVLVPEGIVLATESLATLTTNLNIACPHCKTQIQIGGVDCPNPECKNKININIPASSTYYANKLFQIDNRYVGITTAGSGFVTGRTTESHIREFESTNLAERDSVKIIVEKLGEYFLKEAKNATDNFKKYSIGSIFITFLVAGYDKPDEKIGQAYKVEVTQKINIEEVHKAGYCVHIEGDQRVIVKLFKKDPSIPIPDVPFNLLPLQDAVDFAKFLIKTTIDYQRFAIMIPICGGDIDIALITPHEGFKWIQRKTIK